MNSNNFFFSDQQALFNVLLTGDLPDILSWFKQRGGAREELGESVIAATQHVINIGKIEIAKVLLQKLQEGGGAYNEIVMLIIQMLGDHYSADNNHIEARNYYGQLPGNYQNFRNFFRTFLPKLEVDELIASRDIVLSKDVGPDVLTSLHEAVDSVFSEVGANSTVTQEHHCRYEKNLIVLKEIDPEIYDELIDQNFPTNDNNEILSINGLLYEKHNCVWGKVLTLPECNRFSRDNFRENSHVLIRISSPSVLMNFCNTIWKKEGKENVEERFQCYVVIDYNSLMNYMKCVDISNLLKSDFLIKFIDERRVETHLSDVLIDNNNRIPDEAISISAEDQHFFSTIIKPLTDRISSQIESNIQLYEDKMNLLYPADFSLTFSEKVQGKSLRVLFFTSSYTTYVQYSTRDFADGFRQAGYNASILMEGRNEPEKIRRDVLLKKICDYRPDIIFFIDHLRSELPFLSKNIPFVTWVQDPIDDIFAEGRQEGLGKNDYIYTTALSWKKSLEKNESYRKSYVGLLPNLVSPDKYHPLNIPKRFDVTYVAHLHIMDDTVAAYSEAPDSALTAEELRHRYFVKYADTLSLGELLQWSDMSSEVDTDKLWGKFSQWWGRREPSFSHSTMFGVIRVVLRTRVLIPLLEQKMPIRLYGKGWERHPWFAHHAKGAVENGVALNRLQNESRININLSTHMTFHPKVTEVGASGAFLLTKNLGDIDAMPLDHFFTRDKEVVLFDDTSDLLQKVDYYLTHDKEREEIADRFHRRIIEEFTYEKGCEMILENVAK